ncbi:MAG: hypothetical protein H8D96_17545 [Desulfobacterales bacterium]|uniref:Uncharacterized protein n=1 Tax=Candidatus Desulfatibia vada TaxID=2841696 RepID=A0A8J6TW14_9BACT|nr:hypothetical protein [Candidatus Desulfatibia vada]
MSIFNKAKDSELLSKAKKMAGKLKDKPLDLIGDETLAEMIMAAVSKQEDVNKVLNEKGSNYRISDIEIEMGIPPKLIFGIRRKSENKEEDSSKMPLLKD